MSTIKLIIAFIFICSSATAQLTQEQRIQDSIIGWWNTLPKKATTASLNNGYNFTVAQQEQINEIIRCMFKTYYPVGGLATYKKLYDADLGAQKRFPPHIYGVEFRIWDVSFDKQWLTPEGKFKPINEQYTSFFIRANHIPENKPIIFINNKERYVFVMPPDGSGGEQLKESRKDADKGIHPNAHPFLTLQSENQHIFLVPDNQLPIKTVTKGELLDMAASSIDNQLKLEWERVQQQFSNDESRQKAYASRKKDIESFRTKIQQLRTKHQNSLDEPAVVNNAELTVRQFDINPDPFDISQSRMEWKQYYTVHQYDKALLEKCRTDQPQWIVISFPFIPNNSNNQLKELYAAMTEHFNYAYAFDYFFVRDKTKGVPYKPANEEDLKKRLGKYHGTY